MKWFMSWRRSAFTPLWIVLQQLDVEPIANWTGCPDVECVLGDLTDGADTRQREEEAEMVGKVFEGTGDGLAADRVFGLEVHAVSSEG